MRKLVLSAALVAAGAAQLRADTVINKQPGNIAGDQVVLFNDSGLLGTGNTVQGLTNQTSTVFDFTGAGESLSTPALGQARIEGTDGDLTALTITPHVPGTTFTSLIFNLNANSDGSVTITADRKGEAPISGTFDISKNGQNFFQIVASNNEVLTDVSFTSTAQLADVRQVRAGVTAVPVPASVLGGMGLLGLLGAAKLWRRQMV